MRARVLVAMSGGVDSSVAAAMLKEQGYDVVGATMKVWPQEECLAHRRRPCCSVDDIRDAKDVCGRLGIRHYVLNLARVFHEEVIKYFISEYMSGRTPNPCIICNEKIKFGRLLKKAGELECAAVATGHYARIENVNGGPRLRTAVDRDKDQSYVLFSLGEDQLRRAIFPVGGLRKEEVRKIARSLGLRVHKKADSQEICFVTEGRYSDFIRRSIGLEEKKGVITDKSGQVIGHHRGFWNFTIGQRKGLGVARGEPLYVVDIIPRRNVIVVGSESDVKKMRFKVSGVNWIYGSHPSLHLRADVKIRYTHRRAPARITNADNGSLEVEFLDGPETVTPGQAAVFYDGDYVIGGGWIEGARV